VLGTRAFTLKEATMPNYVLIESRDPLEYQDVSGFYDLARDLSTAGNPVTFFLVQNGVAPTRRGCRFERVPELQHAGVTVLADDFSLRERAIPTAKLHDNVKVSNVDALVDLLMQDDTKAIWH